MERPSKHFEEAGYIFVYQDARGRYMSEGEFQQVRPHIPDKRGPSDIDESSDAYDTIDWLLENVPNHNGKAGMAGISQPGFHVAASIIDSHPALKCASPQAPTADYYMGDDVYHTFRKGHRMMVQVQSSWFPLVDRNPQQFMDIPKAKPEDFQKATQRIYRSGSQGSSVTVLVSPPFASGVE